MNKKPLVRHAVRLFCRASRRGAGLLGCFLLAAGAPGGRADILLEGAETHQGSFRGYRDGAFAFTTASGDLLTVPRTDVRRLTLDPPRAVTVRSARGQGGVAGEMVGYQQGKFRIVTQGRQREIAGLFVDSVTVRQPPAGNGAERPPMAASIDIGRLEAQRAQWTPEQAAAVERYRAARERHDAFQARSSALVAAMDGATGAARERLLDSLRLRKSEEQPIVNELRAAQAQLLNCFPEAGAADGTQAEPQPGGSPPAAASETIVFRVPPLGEHEVLLLDTRVLGQDTLNETQTAAIAQYDAVSERYRKIICQGTLPDSVDASVVRTELQTAQSALLAAFPNVRLVEEAE